MLIRKGAGRKITFLIGITAFFFACSAQAKKPRVVYPKELQGVWQLGYEPCKLPGDLDSDGRIEIKPEILKGYEDDSVPLKVVAVSKAPNAWRITYLLRIDEHADKYSAVFVLSGRHTLTIVDESRPAVYTRCN